MFKITDGESGHLKQMWVQFYVVLKPLLEYSIFENVWLISHSIQFMRGGGLSVNKWSDVKCSDVERTDVIYVKWVYFEVKWVTLKFLGTKVPYTLGWPYTEGTWLYCDYFIWCISCTVVVFNLFCNMWVCGCVGFVMFWCVYVWGF